MFSISCRVMQLRKRQAVKREERKIGRLEGNQALMGRRADPLLSTTEEWGGPGRGETYCRHTGPAASRKALLSPALSSLGGRRGRKIRRAKHIPGERVGVRAGVCHSFIYS